MVTSFRRTKLLPQQPLKVINIFFQAVRKLHNRLRAENISIVASESFTTSPANQISNLKVGDKRGMGGGGGGVENLGFYRANAVKVF